MNFYTGKLAAKIPALCSLARFTFAAVLLVFFGGASSLSKLGEGLLGLFHPSAGEIFKFFPNKWKLLALILAALACFIT